MDAFVDVMLPILMQLMYSKNKSVVSAIAGSFADLASIDQEKVFEAIMPHVSEALNPDNVTQVIQLLVWQARNNQPIIRFSFHAPPCLFCSLL